MDLKQDRLEMRTNLPFFPVHTFGITMVGKTLLHYRYISRSVLFLAVLITGCSSQAPSRGAFDIIEAAKFPGKTTGKLVEAQRDGAKQG